MASSRKSAPRAGRQASRGVVASNGAPTRVGKAESARDATETTRGPGRPPARSDGIHRTERVTIRWAPSELAETLRRAAAAGIDLAEYVRRAVLAD